LKRWKREARKKGDNAATENSAELKLKKRKGEDGYTEIEQNGGKKRQRGSAVLYVLEEKLAAAVKQPRQSP
jgi:hypothetical protein